MKFLVTFINESPKKRESRLVPSIFDTPCINEVLAEEVPDDLDGEERIFLK